MTVKRDLYPHIKSSTQEKQTHSQRQIAGTQRCYLILHISITWPSSPSLSRPSLSFLPLCCSALLMLHFHCPRAPHLFFPLSLTCPCYLIPVSPLKPFFQHSHSRHFSKILKANFFSSFFRAIMDMVQPNNSKLISQLWSCATFKWIIHQFVLKKQILCRKVGWIVVFQQIGGPSI